MITRTEAKATPPPPPPFFLLLRVSYSLSLICQPDIRGHEASHHRHSHEATPEGQEGSGGQEGGGGCRGKGPREGVGGGPGGGGGKGLITIRHWLSDTFFFSFP